MCSPESESIINEVQTVNFVSSGEVGVPTCAWMTPSGTQFEVRGKGVNGNGVVEDLGVHMVRSVWGDCKGNIFANGDCGLISVDPRSIRHFGIAAQVSEHILQCLLSIRMVNSI